MNVPDKSVDDASGNPIERQCSHQKMDAVATGASLAMCSALVLTLFAAYTYILQDEFGKREALEAKQKARISQKKIEEARVLALPPEYAEATHAEMVLPYLHGADPRSQSILGKMWHEAPAEARDGLGFNVMGKVTGRVVQEPMEDEESFEMRLHAAYDRSQDYTTVEFAKMPKTSVFALSIQIPLIYLNKPVMLPQQRVIWPPSSFHVALSGDIVLVVENGRLSGILERGTFIPFDETVEEIYRHAVISPLKK